MSDKTGKWQAKAMSAAMTVLVVALGARVAWELLGPLVPLLALIVMLGVIYALIFGRLR